MLGIIRVKFITTFFILLLLITGCAQPSPKKHITPEVANDRSLDNIRITLDNKKDVIYNAYTQYLTKDPNAKGKFIFSFVIMPSGAVEKVRYVRGDINDKMFIANILGIIKNTTFNDKGKAPQKVQYKFEFYPE